MHGLRVCHKARVRRVSSKWENNILGLYGLEEAYDTIDRHCMWQMLRLHVCSWRKIVESSAEFLHI